MRAPNVTNKSTCTDSIQTADTQIQFTCWLS